ncbi:MAG TPA: serine/threonine-protein kinase, partial [Polyangiaceae bacterium]|nr:serine/threonine-protein kinase [Polyangiaceae bacterium]
RVTMAEVNEGDVLSGKYRIERVLGQGGMGIVVAATHLQLDQRVAIKFLLPSAIGHAETVARFSREARAAVRIRSEHVARVIDVGNLETGAPYMVMEYLEGSDLARRVSEQGPLSIAEASTLLLQACEALAEAHSLGIVHRDLKPANLFLTHHRDGSVCLKVLDFGISKLTVSGDPGFDMTNTAAVMGSPYYMSPEQMRSTRNVDVRTDIWALGVILYEIVSGRVPFEAETMPQLCGMVLQEPPPPLQRFRANTPDRFEAVILRCLEKDPQRRYQNVGEFAVALGEFAPPDAQRSVERASRLSGAPMTDSNSGVSAKSLATTAEQFTQSGFGGTSHRGRSRGWPSLVVALCLLAGIAALVWLRRGEPPSSAQSPSLSAEPAAQVAASGAAVVRAGEPPPIASVAAPESAPSASVVPPRLDAARTSHAPSAPASPSKPSAASSKRSAPAAASAARAAPSAAVPRPTLNPLDGRL